MKSRTRELPAILTGPMLSFFVQHRLTWEQRAMQITADLKELQCHEDGGQLGQGGLEVQRHVLGEADQRAGGLPNACA